MVSRAQHDYDIEMHTPEMIHLRTSVRHDLRIVLELQKMWQTALERYDPEGRGPPAERRLNQQQFERHHAAMVFYINKMVDSGSQINAAQVQSENVKKQEREEATTLARH